MTKSGLHLFISRDCLLSPTSGGSSYALDILRYLDAKGIRVEILLLTPSRLSYGFLLPGVIAGTGLHVRSPGFLRFGRWNVHVLAMMMLPLRIMLAQCTIRFRNQAPARICSHILQWLKRKTFPTWPAGELSHFEADPSEGETRHVAKLLRRKSIEAVILNYICLTPLLSITSRSPAIKRVVLAHDVWHLRANNLRKAGLVPDLKEWSMEEEANRYRYSDRVVGISWDERPVFGRMLGENRVITATKAVRLRDAGLCMVEARCLFVGTDMPSNLDGVTWFLEEIWPLVIHTHPHATLHICGTICRKIENPPAGVILCGVVADLAEQYEQASVVVIPLRSGSGVKIKLTEAVGFMRCCVSTTCGMEGLPAKGESGILVADLARDFSTHVNMLIGSADAREKYLATTTAWASRHLNPDACYGELLEYLKSA